jgi:hypothetical protein
MAAVNSRDRTLWTQTTPEARAGNSVHDQGETVGEVAGARGRPRPRRF